ncbi:dehydrogenase/reductase SDR family member 11-like [Lycorma delicatula]|uniref:dehydrogenase/reductase SDR family member 11-like n=1 Tax=Lycorma delicatula TaxID=130591 RepID=UPI003F51116D
MERWSGRVAVVTGASAGVGAAVLKALASHGLSVVGLARRKHRVKELAEELQNQGCSGKVFAVRADISREEDILLAFSWIEKTLGGIDVFVNCAAITSSVTLIEGRTEEWRRVLEVNLLGPCICAREAVKLMKARQAEDAHIININSNTTNDLSTGQSLVRASRQAAALLGQGLRAELIEARSRIRVTNVFASDVSGPGAHQFAQVEERQAAELVTFILAAPPAFHVTEVMLRSFGEKVNIRTPK